MGQWGGGDVIYTLGGKRVNKCQKWVLRETAIQKKFRILITDGNDI